MSVASSDVYLHEQARRAVKIGIGGGTFLKGNLVVPKTRSIAELLNGPHPFVEFESGKGERIFLAKSAIQSVQSLDGSKKIAR